VVGNLYFREDLLNRKVCTLPTEDDKFFIGPIVTGFMFAGGRKLRLPRNLGPYSNDGGYMAALTDTEAEDMKFLQLPEARMYADFDEDLAEEAAESIEALGELQEAWKILLPSHPQSPVSVRPIHHDLALSNILVDPATFKITRIVDWECTGTRPFWEERYPMFLEGREVEEKPEPLSPGDEDMVRVEYWEGREKSILRRPWDEKLRNVDRRDNTMDKTRLEWRRHLDWLEMSVRVVVRWVRIEFEKWNSKLQADLQ